MKTFQQFMESTKPNDPLGIKYGQRYAGTKPSTFVNTSNLRSFQYPIKTPKPTMPNSGAITVGLGLGQVLAKAATHLAGQRREQQRQRYTSLIPSGTTDVSGKPAQIKPLNK